jgi:hypothetical protein
MADETFTLMLLTDRAKRSEQLRISFNDQRLASKRGWFIGASEEIVHTCLRLCYVSEESFIFQVIGRLKVKN